MAGKRKSINDPECCGRKREKLVSSKEDSCLFEEDNIKESKTIKEQSSSKKTALKKKTKDRLKERRNKDSDWLNEKEVKDPSKDEAKEDKCVRLRNELSDMSFEDLLKLKSSLGTKVFNATAFEEDQQDTGRQILKRENKNRPSEVSSKISVKKFKPVLAVKKQVVRDPRFDDISGEFNETYFHQAYGFLFDIKQREKQKLCKSIKKEKDLEKRQKMENLLKKMNQQEKNEKEKNERQMKAKDWKKKERELVLKGKTPFYLKKSEKKKLEESEKLKLLSEKGKLNKYLKKKDKKLLSRERQHLSFL